eukprot:Skav219426  [mRNA]  locus=scaffold571:401557:402936:- [translate_table: standard]
MTMLTQSDDCSIPRIVPVACGNIHYKVQRHLMYSQQCRQALQARRMRCAPVPGRGSQVDQSQIQTHDGLAPVLAGQGPVQAWLPPREMQAYHVHLDELLADILIEVTPATIGAAEDTIRSELAHMAVAWEDMCLTLQHFANQYTTEDQEITGVSREDIQALFARVSDPTSWSFLQQTVQSGSSAKGSPSAAGACLAEYAKDGGDEARSWYEQQCPRPLGRHCIILHLFSGRRRYGDLHFYLDRSQTPAVTTLHTVSLDIMVDSTLGDVTRDSTRCYWMHSISQCWTLSLFTRPPCESWSVARHRTLTGVARGPRVIREFTHIWGVHSTSRKEHHQLQIGNDLMQFSLEGLHELYIAGGFGALEHPAEPEEQTAACAWRTWSMLYLLSLPGVERVRVLQVQGALGAFSPKPTDVLTVRIPDMPRQFQRWTLTSGRLSGASIGVSSSGEFLTSRLKSIPLR